MDHKPVMTPREEMMAAVQMFAEEWKSGTARAGGSPGRTAVYLAMDRLEASLAADQREAVELATQELRAEVARLRAENERLLAIRIEQSERELALARCPGDQPPDLIGALKEASACAQPAVKYFPVLNQQNRPRLQRKEMPRSVPWEFAEKFRAQAEKNHGQTLERLAERGGLAPQEMYVAANGMKLSVLFGSDCSDLEDVAIAWLYKSLGGKEP
jgi:hypothetical protein